MDFSSTLAQAAQLPCAPTLSQKPAAHSEAQDKSSHGNGKKADTAVANNELASQPVTIVSGQAVTAATPHAPTLPLSAGTVAGPAEAAIPRVAGVPQSDEIAYSVAAPKANPASNQPQAEGSGPAAPQSGTMPLKGVAPADSLNAHTAAVFPDAAATKPAQGVVTGERAHTAEEKSAQAISQATPGVAAREASGAAAPAIAAVAAAKTEGHEAILAALPIPLAGERAAAAPVAEKPARPGLAAAKTDAAAGTSRPVVKEAGASAGITRQASVPPQASGDTAAGSSENGSGDQNAGGGNGAAITVTPSAAHDGGLPAQPFVSLQAPQPAAHTDAAPGASGRSKDEDSGVSVADATSGAASPQALPSINTARVIQSMQGSEMRVGMHSAEFGSVSISTTMTHQTLAAQISFDHAELGRALTAHLPAMEARLSSEYGMQARVEVRDGSFGAATDHGGSAHQQQGERSASRGFTPGAETMMAGRSAAPTAAVSEMVDGGGRVDIRV